MPFTLAFLYGVETRRLNEQVKRNIERFPSDFMFQLTKEEFDFLISQFAMSNITDSQDNKNLKSQIDNRKLWHGFSQILMPEGKGRFCLIRTEYRGHSTAAIYLCIAEK